MQQKIDKIQKNLQKTSLDGWLLWDFQRSNELALQLLEFPDDQMLTRRFFYWIPKKGEPIKIVHAIEVHLFDYLPGKVLPYTTWQSLHQALKSLLVGKKQVAMEYSSMNKLPTFSKVDAGTYELVASFHVKIESSDQLFQEASILSSAQLESQKQAVKILEYSIEQAFSLIATHLGKINEWQVQQFLLEEFEKKGCVTEGVPICAVNQHSANPHYTPDKKHASIISKGDFILIDAWCKLSQSEAVFADLTRVAVAEQAPTAKQSQIFDCVYHAQDEAIKFISERFFKKESVCGWEVDQIARTIIKEYQLEPYFIHRLGHNIGTHVHGLGTHLDNFETFDTRPLLMGTCFSVEPGVYLPDSFGVRLESNLLIDHLGEVQVTDKRQEKITCLL